MVYKYQYKNDSERNNLINEHSDLYLIEDHNITEGNFLIFTDTESLEVKLSQMQDDNLVLMDALATTYEELIMLKSELGGISS